MTDFHAARITVTDQVIFQQLEDETVLLNMESEQYHSLDEVGTRMWQLLREHGATEPAIAQLLREYEVDEATLRQDVAQFVAALAERGLLQVERGEPGA